MSDERDRYDFKTRAQFIENEIWRVLHNNCNDDEERINILSKMLSIFLVGNEALQVEKILVNIALDYRNRTELLRKKFPPLDEQMIRKET